MPGEPYGLLSSWPALAKALTTCRHRSHVSRATSVLLAAQMRTALVAAHLENTARRHATLACSVRSAICVARWSPISSPSLALLARAGLSDGCPLSRSSALQMVDC